MGQTKIIIYMLNIECLFPVIGFKNQALVLNAFSMAHEFGSALLGC